MANLLRELTFIKHVIDENRKNKICQFLQFPNAHKLQFLACIINQDELAEIAVRLESNNSLQHLELKETVISKEGTTLLFTAIGKNNSIRLFKFAQQIPAAKLETSILSELGNNHSLTELNFSSTRLGDAAETLFCGFVNNKSIAVLMLKDMDISPRGGVALANWISNSHTLREITLEKNQIGTAAVELFKAISQSNVTYLNLKVNFFKSATKNSTDPMKTNGINPKTAVAFAPYLSNCTSLQYLGLGGNRDLEYTGTKVILAELPPNLTSLDIAMCWSFVNKASCLREVYQLIRSNSSLTNLAYTANAVKDVEELIRALGSNHSLKQVICSDNCVGTHFYPLDSELVKILDSNTTITDIQFSGISSFLDICSILGRNKQYQIDSRFKSTKVATKIEDSENKKRPEFEAPSSPPPLKKAKHE